MLNEQECYRTQYADYFVRVHYTSDIRLGKSALIRRRAPAHNISIAFTKT